MSESVDYSLLLNQLSALVKGVPYPLANLSNAAALLYDTLPDLNWAGFYLLRSETGVFPTSLEAASLILGPFQGKPACIVIPVGKGVCGTAVARAKTIRVEDVHAFPGHIACDSASRSELVVPLREGGLPSGRILGVLDLDSPILSRFSPADQQGLQAFAALLCRECRLSDLVF